MKRTPAPLVERSEFLIDLSLYTSKITSTIWLPPAVFRTDSNIIFGYFSKCFLFSIDFVYKIHSINRHIDGCGITYAGLVFFSRCLTKEVLFVFIRCAITICQGPWQSTKWVFQKQLSFECFYSW